MVYSGAEKRKHPRISGSFILSYRLMDKSETQSLTQTRNISVGGMFFTANHKFDNGAKILVEVRLPFSSTPVTLIGNVVDSCEVVKGLIYNIRIEFIKVDSKDSKIIEQTVDFYSKMESSIYRSDKKE